MNEFKGISITDLYKIYMEELRDAEISKDGFIKDKYLAKLQKHIFGEAWLDLTYFILKIYRNAIVCIDKKYYNITSMDTKRKEAIVKVGNKLVSFSIPEVDGYRYEAISRKGTFCNQPDDRLRYRYHHRYFTCAPYTCPCEMYCIMYNSNKTKKNKLTLIMRDVALLATYYEWRKLVKW